MNEIVRPVHSSAKSRTRSGRRMPIRSTNAEARRRMPRRSRRPATPRSIRARFEASLTAGSPTHRYARRSSLKGSWAMNAFPRFDLEGQTALVTGAARGLGRAISLALANAGANVALGLRDVSTGSDLANEIGSLGRTALPLAMDVRHLHQVRAGIDMTVERLGRLDILVNNAGIAPTNPAEDVNEADFDDTLRVNEVRLVHEA